MKRFQLRLNERTWAWNVVDARDNAVLLADANYQDAKLHAARLRRKARLEAAKGKESK